MIIEGALAAAVSIHKSTFLSQPFTFELSLRVIEREKEKEKEKQRETKACKKKCKKERGREQRRMERV